MRTVRGKVLSAERVKSARTTVFRVRLREPVPPPADRAVNLRADGELAAIVRPGDAIEVRTWRDVQVSVSRDGVSETLPALPDESATMFAGLALVGVWLSIVAFLASFGSARRARRIARGLSYPSRIPFGAAKLAGVVAAPLAVGYLAGRVWDGWTAVGMTVALWALVAVSATLGALRWHRERPVVAPPVAVRPDVEPCGAG
ncbi:hypothetical protein ACIP6P_13240 [Streptomyces sp. NPDC088729]|uniref:hypothetical protein n=1 Tax=unclassified Streptomyces TaxID=2593676 RepID=UPI000F550021|nr:hypothetical protein [Streptomyces sp. ADI96-02]